MSPGAAFHVTLSSHRGPTALQLIPYTSARSSGPKFHGDRDILVSSKSSSGVLRDPPPLTVHALDNGLRIADLQREAYSDAYKWHRWPSEHEPRREGRPISSWDLVENAQGLTSESRRAVGAIQSQLFQTPLDREDSTLKGKVLVQTDQASAIDVDNFDPRGADRKRQTPLSKPKERNRPAPPG